MPPETELIKQQMGQTRAALSEKLESWKTRSSALSIRPPILLPDSSGSAETVTQTVQEVGCYRAGKRLKVSAPP